MKTLALGMILLMHSSDLFAGDQPDTQMASKTHGFSITLPVDKAAETQLYQFAVFYLPASDGYPPSVNIQRQRYGGTMLKYDSLSKSQFEELEVELIAAEFKKGVLMYEYQSNAQGKQMHWYSKAYKHGDYVYLVTATALETQWESRKKQLVDSVDSFKIDVPGE